MGDDPTVRILDAIAQLGAEVGRVRSDLTEQIDRVRGELTEEIGRVRTDLTEEIGRVRSDLTEEIGRVATGLQESINTTKFTLMDRMDRLQDAISQVKDEGNVNFAISERVERLARGGLDETRSLAEQMTLMERQIRRLNDRVDNIENKA
jgi:methyl-accepting chemotaxis protein